MTTTETAPETEPMVDPPVDQVEVTFDSHYPVAKLTAHPQNPRRNAVADPEMVASIKEHGVLEPVVIGPDGTIIMGHRRTDGCRKAKHSTIPVLIRHDLDTSERQLEVALVENMHREDLSEMEEAESFGLLRDLGYTQKAIATKVGRSPKLVGERLKLLKLSPKTSDALHKGQLSITDAIALAEFDDDPKLQDKLARKNGYEMTRAIERARRDRKALAEIAVERAKLEADGVHAIEVEAGTRPHNLTKADCTRLQSTNAPRRTSHKKCLAFVVCPADKDGWYAPELVLVCTSPKSHKAPGPSKKELEARAKREAENEAREAAEAAITEAALGRAAALVAIVPPGVTLDPRVLDTLRVLLVDTLWELAASDYAFVLAATGDLIPDRARWSTTRQSYGRNDDDHDARGEFIDWSATQAAATLLAILIAILAEKTNGTVRQLRFTHRAEGPTRDARLMRETGRRYLGFLDEIGHDLGDNGRELLKAANWTEPNLPSVDGDVIDQPVGEPEEEPDPYDALHMSAGTGLALCGLPGTTGKSLTTTRELDNVTCDECVDLADCDEIQPTGDVDVDQADTDADSDADREAAVS